MIFNKKNTIFTTSKKLTWPVIRPLTTKSSPHVCRSSFPEPNGAKMPGFVVFELCEISEVKLLSHLGVNCDYTRAPLEAPDFPDFLKFDIFCNGCFSQGLSCLGKGTIFSEIVFSLPLNFLTCLFCDAKSPPNPMETGVASKK